MLGKGGFGEVLLARDEELDRRVAIKIPRPDKMRDADKIADYLAEACTVAGLDHPGIVPVYDVGRSDDGHPYVVLYELLAGRRPFSGSTQDLLPDEGTNIKGHWQSQQQLDAAKQALGQAGLKSLDTLHVFLAADGSRKYSAVQSGSGEDSTIMAAYAGWERVD